MSSKSTGLDVTVLRAVADLTAAGAQATYYMCPKYFSTCKAGALSLDCASLFFIKIATRKLVVFRSMPLLHTRQYTEEFKSQRELIILKQHKVIIKTCHTTSLLSGCDLSSGQYI